MKLTVQSKLINTGGTTKDLLVRRDNKIERYTQGNGWTHLKTTEFKSNAEARRELNSHR